MWSVARTDHFSPWEKISVSIIHRYKDILPSLRNGGASILKIRFYDLVLVLHIHVNEIISPTSNCISDQHALTLSTFCFKLNQMFYILSLQDIHAI